MSKKLNKKTNKQIKTIAKNDFVFTFNLFFIFLILKLTNVIDWSWLYITMPLWIGFVALLIFSILSTIFLGFFSIFLLIYAKFIDIFRK